MKTNFAVLLLSVLLCFNPVEASEISLPRKELNVWYIVQDVTCPKLRMVTYRKRTIDSSYSKMDFSVDDQLILTAILQKGVIMAEVYSYDSATMYRHSIDRVGLKQAIELMLELYKGPASEALQLCIVS
jgi:hypothetical protein